MNIDTLTIIQILTLIIIFVVIVLLYRQETRSTWLSDCFHHNLRDVRALRHRTTMPLSIRLWKSLYLVYLPYQLKFFTNLRIFFLLL